MADPETEKKIELTVELNEPQKDTKESYDSFDPTDHEIPNRPAINESETDILPSTMSESTLNRVKSVKERKQKLRLAVDDMWADEDAISPRNGSSNDVTKTDQLGPHQNTGIMNRITSILIDELNDQTGTIDYETCKIELPKSPICALLLMEFCGDFQTMGWVNKVSIFATIVVTMLIQTAAGATLFVKQLDKGVAASDPSIDLYSASDGFLNLVVISFVVIYLAQDCAQIYKVLILMRWMRSLKDESRKLKRHAALLLGAYLITNIMFYVFLLYYSVVELIITDELSAKLQAAVAVYFILELDDWLYAVTIEPLKILDDEIFTLEIKGHVGSRNRRFKKVTYAFWGVFFIILVIQFLMFITKLQEKL